MGLLVVSTSPRQFAFKGLCFNIFDFLLTPQYAHLYQFFKGTRTETKTFPFKLVLTSKLSHYAQVNVCVQYVLTLPYADLAAAGYEHFVISVTGKF